MRTGIRAHPEALFAAMAFSAVLSLASATAFPATAQQQTLESITIIAPASPGGGWDQTARAMQEVLQQENIARTVQVQNISGAGGTIGLAQFVTQRKGDAKSLLVGGLVMVGAIQTNQSPVTLDQVTPIARLTGEYEVVVVPASSDVRTMDDLVQRLKADPRAVSWAGGSAGGTDHMLVGLIAQAAGVQPAQVNYIPYSGGGEALASLLGGHVSAGVSSYGEFAGQIAAGQLRALALSAPQRVAGIDVPTLVEQGINVELTNWRGVFAPPGLQDQSRQALAAAIDRMVKSESWQATLRQRDWIDLYQPPQEFAGFLAADRQRVETVLEDIGLVQATGQTR
ncbi:MAG TPA: tripartite tricarboxylate transporter substrate binding protein [Azospirillaceae bacterium]|nr:tripartite tricarboxylate transporter substrate binding protein [Azospirillaceae bacterium]